MTRPTPLSGFPEWLPAQRVAEQQVLDRLRRTFELYGFASLETRAVEPLDQLLRKGETSKEVYTLRRLQAGEGDDEIPLVIGDALRSLPIPPVKIMVNNRKLCEGFYRGLGLEDPEEILRIVDKMDKIGPNAVAELIERAGGTDAQAKACLALAEIRAQDASFADAVRALGVEHPLLDEGVAELTAVVETAREHSPGLVEATLKIARGLDYYTGTVYETELVGYEQYGSICSGGRYDNLASAGKDVFPGVGISIGVSRLLGLLFDTGELAVSRPTPTAVLVALWSEEERAASNRIAAGLRARGIATEVAPVPAKLGKQIRYAERRGIPYVWFPASASAEGGDQVKDIRSGDQVAASSEEWNPPAEDMAPRLL
jgi:histidyl-tRNA synthetase